MTILAVDPGSDKSAYVLWNGISILDKGILSNPELLNRLPMLQADTLVIEQVCSYGMPVGAEVFETVFFSGRLAEAWGSCFERIPRLTVKMHLCHDSKARDSNIRQALIDRFGNPGTKRSQGITYGLSKDLWSAFALAVTYYDLWL